MNKTEMLSQIFFFFLLFLNIVVVWITLTYGSFLGFTFNHFIIVSLTIITVVSSIFMYFIEEKRYKISYRLKWVILICSAVFIRLLFLVNENPVIPEEFDVLLLMPLEPILRLPWFFQNYQTVLGLMMVHPPVSFILSNLGYLIIPNFVGLRLFSFILSVVSVWFVYMIAKEFSQKISYITALFYSLNPLAVMYTIMGYTDGYCLFFGLIGTFFLIRGLKKTDFHIIISGVFIGLSLLSKSTISLIWLFIIVLIALFLQNSNHSLSLRRNLAKASLSISTTLAMITPWAFINPQSFYYAYIFRTKYLILKLVNRDFIIGVMNPTSEIISQTTPEIISQTTPEIISQTTPEIISQATPDSLIINLLQKIFPRYTGAIYGTISSMELYVKLFIFLTPVIVVTAIFGLLVLMKWKKDGGSYRRIILLFIWILIPQVAFLILIRAERYFLPSLLPVLILSAYWVKHPKNTLKRAYSISMIGFMMVFLAISFPIANQSYAGPSKIESLIEEYDIPHQKILTNEHTVKNVFLESDVNVIDGYDLIELQIMILQEDYDCIIIWHHNRGSAFQLSEEKINFIETHYPNKIRAGSNFSYIEIFYK